MKAVPVETLCALPPARRAPSPLVQVGTPRTARRRRRASPARRPPAGADLRMPERLPRLLFVCVENSCRSQMAEGFARALGRGRVAAFSAGSRPSGR